MAEAQQRAQALDEDVLRRRAAFADPPRSVLAALDATPGLAVIAEVKRRSPSAGDIDAMLDPVTQASAYASGGAAAVSVLTEPDHFGGSLDDLRRVRSAIEAPVLRKDFIVAPGQVFEARVAGADAVLLIVAALSQPVLERLIGQVQDLGMTPLVEVHDGPETERALSAGARLIGVNNRDLATFDVDLATAETLAPLLVDAEATVAESGIATPEDARRMADAGYRAVLVGEALVRAPDPAAMVRALSGATP